MSIRPTTAERRSLGSLRVLLPALILLLATPLHAQSLSLDMGDKASLTSGVVQLFTLITVLSIAPGILMMVTCFPFMVTVLSILRQAIGVQQSPPNMLIVSLAMFLTWFVMEPVFQQSWQDGVKPLTNGLIGQEQAIPAIVGPFRTFMEARVESDTVRALSEAIPAAAEQDTATAVPLKILVPAFLLTEIKRAFEVGFLIFLPFLIIDLVVAAVLMSMGMMMVPPATVALPFKLVFFVVSDGWSLLASALVKSYTG